VGKKAVLTALRDNSTEGPIGVVKFTAQSGSNFQGTFIQSEDPHRVFLSDDGWEYYGMQQRSLQPVPISGSLGHGLLTLGRGETRYSISFSGTSPGTVLEDHRYLNSIGEDYEGWTVADSQEVSFTGDVVASGADLKLDGSVEVRDTGQWTWAADARAHDDPNHQTYTNEWGSKGVTLDQYFHDVEYVNIF
jgi:hypothetical protein